MTTKEKELLALVRDRGGVISPSMAELMARGEAAASCRLDGETQVIESSRQGGRAKHVQGRMNKMEQKHANYLDWKKQEGEILFWTFESVKLRLADRTWYTPDFAVVMRDGSLEFHETKGHWEDDARAKWKIAGELFPFFIFRAYSKKGVETYGEKKTHSLR